MSGQSGLARFIKLPPVESKKIPDIVKYEARQQIPFSLDDVVWDYQQLTGGSEEDGFALEPEVGLFAMKRDQVARALAPLEEAGIEVDLIQLAPLAVYNYVCFDRLRTSKSQPYDPAKPPASTVVISVGTDTTDLVVTNGYRVWQRNIPIGGNHFTRALSKELKLTFVKAEHLKRNATQADDPKAVFQAMRPVFSDLLAEIQRSLGYFMSLDKAAKVGEVIALGNAMKLPGLQRYLAQNLEQEVKPIEEFNRLTGGQRQRQRAVQGQRAELRAGVRPVHSGARQGRAEDQPAAGGNRHPADGAVEEAVGRRRRGGRARGADVQLLHARRRVARRQRQRPGLDGRDRPGDEHQRLGRLPRKRANRYSSGGRDDRRGSGQAHQQRRRPAAVARADEGDRRGAAARRAGTRARRPKR